MAVRSSVSGGFREEPHDHEGPCEVRAVLYARVSTREQADHGYSLNQQLGALRDYCKEQGYEVVEEISDPGYSGSSPNRPGLDRVRDLVAAGGVDVVLAQDRDRIAREPTIIGWLEYQFADHGCQLRALNDPEEGDHTAELTKNILDSIAKFERANTRQRSIRNTREKLRTGKVVGSGSPPYGYRSTKIAPTTKLTTRRCRPYI